MKLSELVTYRTLLDQLSVLNIQREANMKLDVITHLVKSRESLGDFDQLLTNNQTVINRSFNSFNQNVQSLKNEINRLIEIEQPHWFQESYRLYEEEELVYPTTESLLNRRMNITPETQAFLNARVKMYNSWKYPGMIIRPGLENFINDMVMFDPLYLIDQSYDLLEPAIEQFPIEYQKRLRPYLVNELQDNPILKQIPDNQFGICLAYNFFNFRPLESIKVYLTEIYQKLRPGGALLMTFNDCDRDKAVMLVENHFASYTPGSMLKELAMLIGYEIAFVWDDGGPSTWIEFKKPGKLTSIRGGQTLAKIVHKPVAKSK